MDYNDWNRKQREEFDELLTKNNEFRVGVAFCPHCGKVTYIKGKSTNHKCSKEEHANDNNGEKDSSARG